eukprot:1640085-Pyramimonas_sp.AAC.1
MKGLLCKSFSTDLDGADAMGIDGGAILKSFLEVSGAIFEEVPEGALRGPWFTAPASKALVDANILELEGEALV